MMPMITVTPKRKPRGVQPKKQAPKNAVAVNARRSILVKELLKGTPAKEAGIIAGFSPATAASQVSQTLNNPKFQNSLLAALEVAGLSEAQIVQHLLLLLNGKRYLPVRGHSDNASPADPTDQSAVRGYVAVPDYQAKAKALEMVHKLTGAYTERHELDIKRPVNIVIRKFCSPEEGRA